MWNCNLNKADLINLFPRVKGAFWREVLEAWCIYNFHTPVSTQQVLTQNLWFNSFIKVQNMVIFYRNWYEGGITTIVDLLNENGSLMTYEQFSDKYTDVTVNRLTYYGVLSAIPRHWKQLLLDRDIHHPLNTRQLTEKLLSMDKVCKETYNVFLGVNVDVPTKSTGLRKWELIFNTDYDNSYSDIYNNIYNCTQNVTLNRTFQYHIVHRSLVTNVDLFK